MLTISRPLTRSSPRLNRYNGLYLFLIKAADSLLIWYDRSRERRALLSLDDHMLRDIGLSRAEISNEASKPFWQE